MPHAPRHDGEDTAGRILPVRSPAYETSSTGAAWVLSEITP